MSSRSTRNSGKQVAEEPVQEPVQKKKRTTKSTAGRSGPGGSSTAPRGRARPTLTINQSNVEVPPVCQPDHAKFMCDARRQRYVKISGLEFNQEKTFDDSLLEQVPEIDREIKARGWGRFNEILKKGEERGNATLVKEFYANAFLDGEPENRFLVYIRGKEVDIGPKELNQFLGIENIPDCDFKAEKRRIKGGDEPTRRELKDFVALPGTPWLKATASTIPTKVKLVHFKPLAHAWAEFVVRNIVSNSNSSEYQIENAAAVRVIMEGRPLNLGYWLSYSIRSIARNPNNTFKLGHCNFITALCRAKGVSEDFSEDIAKNAIKPMTFAQYQGFGHPPDLEVNEEEVEIDQFERGVHPDQQFQQPPAAPLYTHSVNELASMLHSMELSHHAGLPNMYYDTSSALYTEAMAYRSTFPPADFAGRYPTQAEWNAHQANEMAAFTFQQQYNTSVWEREMAARAASARVNEEMERELFDVDGFDLNLGAAYQDFMQADPPRDRDDGGQ